MTRRPTDDHDAMNDADFPELIAPDKLYDHHRQQLSAMLDGALPPDQAKFMLRRLQHDGELAACWERWQVCGDILRGRHDVLLPADFSQRVVRAIGAQDAALDASAPLSSTSLTAVRSPRWLRWSGGALAASVALVALFFARQTSAPGVVDPAAGDAPTRIAAIAPSVDSPRADTTTMATASTRAAGTQPGAPSVPAMPGQAPDSAARLAAAVAVAELPRRAAERRSTRAQTQRAAARLRSRDDRAPVTAVAAMSAAPSPGDARSAMPAAAMPVFTASASPVAAGDPFAAQSVAPSRPWPRAILPGYSSSGAFNASYGSSASAAFHPFEPQVAPSAASDAARDASPRGPR